MPAKILVVDDEEPIAVTVRDIFRAKGYKADYASSGGEAVAKSRELCPDLLLSDVIMPGWNGFEAALQVKEFCPGCRLLFFSGYAGSDLLSQDFKNEFMNRGYQFGFLLKPVQPAVLPRTVEEALLQQD
jgi:CheY-like chemotaxis protein